MTNYLRFFKYRLVFYICPLDAAIRMLENSLLLNNDDIWIIGFIIILSFAQVCGVAECAVHLFQCRWWLGTASRILWIL